MTNTTTSLDRRVELLRRFTALGYSLSQPEDILRAEVQRQLNLADEYAGAIRPGMVLAARAVYELMITDAEITVEALLGAVRVLRLNQAPVTDKISDRRGGTNDHDPRP